MVIAPEPLDELFTTLVLEALVFVLVGPVVELDEAPPCPVVAVVPLPVSSLPPHA
jgi:hypothetical protein